MIDPEQTSTGRQPARGSGEAHSDVPADARPDAAAEPAEDSDEAWLARLRRDAPPTAPVPVVPDEDAEGIDALPDVDLAGEPEEPVLAVLAAGLGKRTRRGWVYGGVHLSLAVGDLLAVSGPAGSGRSSLLLTLTGRMRPNRGELVVLGEKLPRRARKVRRRTTVARIGRSVDVQPELKVGEAVSERCAIERVRKKVGRERFADACDLLGLVVDRGTVTETLSLLDQARLSVALAMLAPTEIVVVDDVDRYLHREEERVLWEGLRAVADSGPLVVGACADAGQAVGLADAVLELAPPGTVPPAPPDLDGSPGEPEVLETEDLVDDGPAPGEVDL